MFSYIIGLVVAMIGYNLGRASKDKTLIGVSLALAVLAAYGVGTEFRVLIRG